MIKSDVNKFGKTLYILYPGDYLAVREDCVMTTVVGSSVLVCLYDVNRKIGGMGHFIVPGTIGTEGIFNDEIARHGIQSVELLIGEIVKKGGDRKYLKAKLFGAGNMKDIGRDAESLARSNIKFLHEYFTLEKIDVLNEDLGGIYRRKILFSPMDGKAYRRFLKKNDESSEFRSLEKEYIDSVFRSRGRTGKLILFE